MHNEPEEEKNMDAREVALLTLNACERQGGWSDGVLKKQIDFPSKQVATEEGVPGIFNRIAEIKPPEIPPM